MIETSAGDPRLCLFGAANDTGNLGVSALFYSCVHGIGKRLPDARLTVFDNGFTERSEEISIEGRTFRYTCRGARASKRFYRSDTAANIAYCARLGGLWNRGARAILDADAILDISGGDSFTDLYGPRVFANVCLSKRMALENHKPLILLPQTYGPFSDPKAREEARKICLGASMAWARDERSMQYLQDLVGPDFDPERRLVGVDVAFSLPSKEPALPEEFKEWLLNRDCAKIGVNVSGLVYNRPEEAKAKFSLKADYRAIVHTFIRKILADTECEVLLVPHVFAEKGHYESDVDACESVLENLGEHARDRVRLASGIRDPREAKWIIANLDWFCGTRMHSTIAALSSGVPAAAIAYSPKTIGVFETCGQSDCVTDPRFMETNLSANHLWNAYTRRGDSAWSLSACIQRVIQRAEEQMDLISLAIQTKFHQKEINYSVILLDNETI
jgi:polysaccharide pyruvyl transferase WcaK-like protein